MNLLKNKIAIITGAGKGIGKATAQQFQKEGATIVIAESDKILGEKTADKIGGYFIHTDVSNEKSVNNLFESIKDKFNRLDILVNNAGVLKDNTLKKLSSNDFNSVINVNLKGTYLCGRRAADLMIDQNYGVILNAASVVAHNGNFGQTNYVASKSGVIGMTKVWARELGKYNIRVNAVAPGFIETDMTKNLPEKVVQLMNDKVPLRRWGKTEDIANAYIFLASENASYISGAILNVDGGVVV